MEALRISLNDYILSGGGANGESYVRKTDAAEMLKLYFRGKVRQPLDEMILARKVFEAGIPTPEPGDYVVTEDGRYGIRFNCIIGKKSYSRAVADDPGNLPRYAEEFAGMCHDLHRTHVDTAKFENVKDRYYRLLAESPFFSAGEKDRIGRFISDVPDEDTAIAPYLNQGNDDAKQAFINGDIAITLESTAALKTLLTNVGDSFEIGVGFFPNINADDVGGVSVGGGSLWAFKTGDADREAATWEFVKFMTNPENQAFWNARTGYFPVNVKAQETEAFKANVAQYPQFQVALDQLHSSAPQYAGGLLAVFSQARALVQSYTEKLVHHEIEDVDECVKQLAAEINEAIEMYNLTNY